MLMRIFTYLILIVVPIWAQAQQYGDSFMNKPRLLSLDAKYSMYDDVQNDPNQPRKEIADQVAVSANIRFYRIFSLCALFNQSLDSKIDQVRSFGLGFRVDLPGIFFFGGSPTELIRKRKRRDINTYFQWSKLQVQEPAAEKYVADRMAFGLDGFITGDFYLNFEVALYSHQGNQFFSPGVGIGYEF